MSRVTTGSGVKRKFLGVRFVNCHAYGRLYMAKDGLSYQGGCPKCGKQYRIMVGSGGTAERMFLGYCR